MKSAAAADWSGVKRRVYGFSISSPHDFVPVLRVVGLLRQPDRVSSVKKLTEFSRTTVLKLASSPIYQTMELKLGVKFYFQVKVFLGIM